jgi:hypothetical protein
VVAEESLFAQALLGDVQDLAVGPHRNPLGASVAGGAGHILELEGHHIHAAGEGSDLFQIVVGSHERAVGDRGGG